MQILTRIKPGDEIPETLYLTVEEIIVYIYILKDKVPETYKDTLSINTMNH